MIKSDEAKAGSEPETQPVEPKAYTSLRVNGSSHADRLRLSGERSAFERMMLGDARFRVVLDMAA